MSVEYVVNQLKKELDRATPTGGMQVDNISVPIRENLLQVTILHLEKLEKDNAELKAHCSLLKSELGNLLWHYKNNLNGGTKHMNALIEGVLESVP